MRIGTNGVDPWHNQNPRYAAYCIAQGADIPEERRALDATLYGGRWTRPYVMWIDQQTADWCEEAGVTRSAMGWHDHQQFDQWLIGRHPRPERLLRRRG